jgi:thiol-disulfide isomerase/thioredoxin
VDQIQLLKNKILPVITSSILHGVVYALFIFPVSAAWDVQPKLGHRMAPLQESIPAPDFVLGDMDEEKVSLKELRGKVVLINFWATWCPPCRREMPSMERLYQKINGDNFTVLAVNQMEAEDLVFAFTGQLEVDLTFTILFDKDSSVSQAFNVKGLPTSYLIDKKGNIRYRAIGGREFDHPEVEKLITNLIQE